MGTLHTLWLSLSILPISGFNAETGLFKKDRVLSFLTSPVDSYQSLLNIYS